MASQQRYGSMVVRHCKLCCWRLETFPQDLRDAAIITMYKNKMSDCSNYRGITFLSITSKILPRVLLNRPVPTIAEQHLPEIQCGFRANRRTTDMVFVLMQIQQKCRRQNKGLQITSVDLTKAFETVCRKGLWKILEKPRAPPKIPHHGHQASRQFGRVKHSNDLSQAFPIANGMKQGCVTAIPLFTIFSPWCSSRPLRTSMTMVTHTYVFVPMAACSTRGIWRRTQRPWSIWSGSYYLLTTVPLLPHTESTMQWLACRFAEAAQAFRLEVSWKKRLKDIICTEQRPELPTVTLTWHASTYKVHNFHQMYML